MLDLSCRLFRTARFLKVGISSWIPGLYDLTYLVTLVFEYIVKWLLLWYPPVLTCCYELNMLGSSGTSWWFCIGVLRFGLILTMLLNYFRLIIVVIARCDFELFGLNRY